LRTVEASVYVVETGGLRPVVVELLTDEGVSGVGEAAVGFGVGCNAAAAMIADLAEAFVLGKDPKNIGELWNDFYYHTFWGKGGGAILFAAASALEQALWDIKGKVLNVPIYELLGGKQRDRLRVYANGWADKGFARPEDVAERALEVVSSGYNAIKLYPLSQRHPQRLTTLHIKNREVSREQFRRGVAAVRLVREAVGEGVDVMVDASAEGTPDVMTAFGRELEPYRLMWYEEPLDPFDTDSFKPLKNKLNIPIAAGERLYTRYGFRSLIEQRAADILQPDPGTCGGILEAFKIAAMAEAYQMRVAPHNCGGAVLTAASVQVSACISNFVIQEVFPFRSSIFREIVEDAPELRITDGYVDIPCTPGMGVRLNHQAVDPFRTHQKKM